MAPVETCSDSYSSIFGYLSIYCWLVAQIPQQVENYRNKRCDGISFAFLVLWFMGDLTSLIGCLLTSQLQFQIYLAVYFLYNDFILFSQWYYYSFIYKHRHRHHHHHHSNNNQIPVIQGIPVSRQQEPSLRRKSMVKSGLMVASTMLGSAKGAPLKVSGASHWTPKDVGVYVSWICAVLYLGARLPQLYKNFKRKSVKGISPLLFFTAIVANLCYTISILANCKLSMEYFMIELPYILGSSGTIIFDLAYFYQKWLYEQDKEADESTRLIQH